MDKEIKMNDRYLKYGDRILLKTNDPPFRYLISRSQLEEEIFAIQTKELNHTI